MKKKAVVLLSGGLDSATVLAIARSENYAITALAFDYGQRSKTEILSAKALCYDYKIPLKIINLDIGQFGGSALTDKNLAIPGLEEDIIPITYVPARNTIFLSIALGLAETLNAFDIFIGANMVDYSGYPDCRDVYLKQFEILANLATKAGLESQAFKIHAPLLKLSKAEIIQKGLSLGVEYEKTCSCYDADEEGRACGVCASCIQRREGFLALNVADPTRYF